jgi:hypothetical protein
VNESRDHEPPSLLDRLLYAGYLAFWLVATLIALMLLFPERWARVADSVEEFREGLSWSDEGTARVRPRALERLHDRMARSRWPLGVHRYHETIGYELTPGVSVRLRDGSFTSRTHELGFRIPAGQDQRSVEPGGLLSIGCSFTYGDHVEAEQAFTFVAADLLGLPSYNYGVTSYSYVTALLKLEDLARRGLLDRLQPSAIVLGAGEWLLERSTSPFYPTDALQYGYPYLASENGRIFIEQPPERFSIEHQFEFRKRYFPDGRRESELTQRRRALLEEVAPTIFEARSLEERWRTRVTEQDLYDFITSRMHDVALSRGVPALILWMPSNFLNADAPPELRQAVERHGNVHLIESDSAVRDKRRKQMIQNGHPTKEAHRRYGELVARTLQEIGSEGRAVEADR